MERRGPENFKAVWRKDRRMMRDEWGKDTKCILIVNR
jgi:hypothetical protein